MKKLILPLLFLIFACVAMAANERVFRTDVSKVDLIVDGKLQKDVWHVSPQINPDVLETTASEVIFVSDKDTLVINNLKEWESFDFVMLTANGDSAHVRVNRNAANPFENPNPELLKIAGSGNLTREQAVFDIDALIYTLSQVHPDIFSVCKQEDLFRAVNNTKASLPDSVSPTQLYRAVAPIVAMIGDGHTNLNFPTKQFLTAERKRFPVYVDVLPDRSIICKSSLDSVIGKGARILSVNNISADSLINAMLPFVSGERPHFKLSRINTRFTALFEMLFAADSYEVKFQPRGTEKILSHTFPATLWAEILKRCPTTKQKQKVENYSYKIDPQNNVAIMDFREFSDIEKMENFADSMFTDLRNRNIPNLIIDIRNNGGGQSGVGDVLLSYISPVPFAQMDKALIRVTPLTAKLMDNPDISPMFVFYEMDSTQYILPKTPEEGHYSGNVYLLISNKTFSSAGSFSWAFKECGMGTVIGEETGGMNVCYGDVLMYRLPVSNLSTSISFKRFWQLRADENDIHGTLPDINVPSADALDTAMELVKGNVRKH